MKRLDIMPPVTGNEPGSMMFPESQIKAVVASPTQRHVIKKRDMYVNILTKAAAGYTDVVIMVEKPDAIQICNAFRLFADEFDKPLADMDPLQTVEAFVARFGLSVNIAGTVKKFHLESEVVPNPLTKSAQLFEVINLKGHPFFGSQFFRQRSEDRVVEVTLAFAINTKKYRDSLAAHGSA
jgi:hypothetical protein